MNNTSGDNSVDRRYCTSNKNIKTNIDIYYDNCNTTIKAKKDKIDKYTRLNMTNKNDKSKNHPH